MHISQKTDVDYNFRLVAGTIGSPAEYKRPTAAIAIKSKILDSSLARG